MTFNTLISQWKILALWSLLLVFPFQLLIAEEKDMVYVEVERSYLRSGPGVEYAERGVVNKGDALEVLERQVIWLKVQPVVGREGWILKRATTSVAPAPVVIDSLKGKITDLDKENNELQERIRTLADTRQDVEMEASQLKGQVLGLQARVDALESSRELMWAALGVIVLLLGWFLGFLTGMARKQAENKAQSEMANRAMRGR